MGRVARNKTRAARRRGDPTKLPVQFNLKIPWDFKEFLATKAEREHTSQNQLVVDALEKCYGVEFARHEASPAE